MLLVGSFALKGESFPIKRAPSDQDYIGTWDDIQSSISDYRDCGVLLTSYPLNDKKWVLKLKDGLIIEYEIAWEGSTGAMLLDIMSKGSVTTLDMCYTLKLSHRFLKDSPHFTKTREDILWMESLGAKVPPELKEWFILREKETYDYGLPKLNTNKSDFFNTEGVHYVYDHDSLHEAVKVGRVPAYTLFKPEGEEVWCDKGMFWSLCEQQRLNAVFEESCVLAMERCLIPFDNWGQESWAFKKALQKVCTSITSGWFREYSWKNYDKVLKMFDDREEGFLTELFNSGVMNGIIHLNGE